MSATFTNCSISGALLHSSLKTQPRFLASAATAMLAFNWPVTRASGSLCRSTPYQPTTTKSTSQVS